MTSLIVYRCASPYSVKNVASALLSVAAMLHAQPTVCAGAATILLPGTAVSAWPSRQERCGDGGLGCGGGGNVFGVFIKVRWPLMRSNAAIIETSLNKGGVVPGHTAANSVKHSSWKHGEGVYPASRGW